MRCPLAQIKTPLVQLALDLFADYRRGITPKGKGISSETSAYRSFMRATCTLSTEAESWFAKASRPKKEK